MDSGTTLTGIIIMVIIIIPFLLMGINAKKQKNRIKKDLENIATKNGCKVGQFDIWKNSAFAIDESEKFLIGYRKTNLETLEFFAVLKDFNSCSIQKSIRNVGDEVVVEHLKLAFGNKQNPNKPQYFEFYNSDTDSSQLGDEMQLLTKWHTLIKDRIN